MSYCKCSMMASGGDMAPRLWECEVHGITGMVGPMIIVEKAAKHIPLRLADAKDLAFALLHRLQKEYRKADEIYFCEDHFTGDLQEYFNNTFTWRNPPELKGPTCGGRMHGYGITW